ncbi:MAG: CRTAC1 family protein [Chloroflexi bacterium]|nr:CRTAC1 family protein [Chloroflexota bacterium]
MGRRVALLLCIAITATACTSAAVVSAPVALSMRASAQSTHAALAAAAPCRSSFVEHALPFSTGVRIREMRTYLANGAGVAAGDLDDDGRIDLVFASVDNDSEILWNATVSPGAPDFTDMRLSVPNTRAAAIIDVDADGRLDVVLTRRNAAPMLLRNLGDRRFVRDLLLPNHLIAYTIAFADLNGDGALDIVAASYRAELEREAYSSQEQDARGGAFYYQRTATGYLIQRLADSASTQALAIALIDLDADGRRDIWIGNDFDQHDQIWLRTNEGWQPRGDFFAVTSHSTMSIDWADLGAAGGAALFTTDMNPYDTSPQNLARWVPMMSVTAQKLTAGDVQLPANVMQLRDDDGVWRNEAARRGVDATGWSWSGRFGDFDNDGLQDLYVVNGMVALDLFGHLPDGALIEENRALRGDADGRFTLAPKWGLNSTASGRGMLPVDIDGDGDLDIVINNLRGSARLFENRLCGGNGLLVDLRWRSAQNTRAVGAQLELRTSRGVLRRDVRVMSGYLSGDAPQVHFGIARGVTIEGLDVIWPDGARSQVHDVQVGEFVHVVREDR